MNYLARLKGAIGQREQAAKITRFCPAPAANCYLPMRPVALDRLLTLQAAGWYTAGEVTHIKRVYEQDPDTWRGIFDRAEMLAGLVGCADCIHGRAPGNRTYCANPAMADQLPTLDGIRHEALANCANCQHFERQK